MGPLTACNRFWRGVLLSWCRSSAPERVPPENLRASNPQIALEAPGAAATAAVLKVAVTERAWVIVTTHAPEPVQAPDHPAKVEPAAGLGFNVTEVPDVKTSVQSDPQLTPVGVLRTEPEPVPFRATVNVNDPPPVLKVAVTDRATVIETTHAPEPVQAPDQAANVDPAAGTAVNVTDVPDA